MTRRGKLLGACRAAVAALPLLVAACYPRPETAYDAQQPSTRAVPLALNQGVPLIESDPRATATRHLEQLAARFAPNPSRTPGALRRPWRREGR